MRVSKLKSYSKILANAYFQLLLLKPAIVIKLPYFVKNILFITKRFSVLTGWFAGTHKQPFGTLSINFKEGSFRLIINFLN